MREKTKASKNKDISTDLIIKCLTYLNYADANIQNMKNREKFLMLCILIYVSQNQDILKELDELNVLQFIFLNFQNNKFERKDQIFAIICAIMAN